MAASKSIWILLESWRYFCSVRVSGATWCPGMLDAVLINNHKSLRFPTRPLASRKYNHSRNSSQDGFVSPAAIALAFAPAAISSSPLDASLGATPFEKRDIPPTYSEKITPSCIQALYNISNTGRIEQKRFGCFWISGFDQDASVTRIYRNSSEHFNRNEWKRPFQRSSSMVGRRIARPVWGRPEHSVRRRVDQPTATQ